jgi:uncharacterized protein DUF4383
MYARLYALGFGAVYLTMGILGFFPFFNPLPHDAMSMSMDSEYGYLFGLFPVNAVHSGLHVLFGASGIAASPSFGMARRYCQALGLIGASAALGGLLPLTNTFFGLIPLFGHDIWLHAISACAGLYLGFLAPERVAVRA